jgi:hypothetical protein
MTNREWFLTVLGVVIGAVLCFPIGRALHEHFNPTLTFVGIPCEPSHHEQP